MSESKTPRTDKVRLLLDSHPVAEVAYKLMGEHADALETELSAALKTIKQVADNIAGAPSNIVEWSAKVGNAIQQLDAALQRAETDEGELGEANERAEKWAKDAGRYAANADFWRKRAEKAESALCGLTPGGSEYAGDPQACVEYVRRVRESQHSVIVEFKAKLSRYREAEKALPEEPNPNAYIDDECGTLGYAKDQAAYIDSLRAHAAALQAERDAMRKP